jgi:hypothetical protein
VDRIRRVGVMSVARVMGWLGVFQGVLIAGFYVGLFGLTGWFLGFFAPTANPQDTATLYALGGGAIFAAGLINGVANYLFGIVLGWGINLALACGGGLQVDLARDLGSLPVRPPRRRRREVADPAPA